MSRRIAGYLVPTLALAAIIGSGMWMASRRHDAGWSSPGSEGAAGWQMRVRGSLVSQALWALICASASRAFSTAGVELRSDIEVGLPRAVVDVDRIQQVLANLLDNALRQHTAAPGVVTVVGRRRDALVDSMVADTGDGIDPRHLQRVFERFYRADAGRSRQTAAAELGSPSLAR